VLVALRFLALLPGFSVLAVVDAFVGCLQIPAILVAILAGHVALARSKARRGLAIAGLVLGHLSVAGYVVIAFLFTGAALFGAPAR